ncbi:MAG: NAD(P)H-hydrate epimerase, partial [Gemmatimonadaceae bacterium]|nr:NAD(P)H-hydrate epimerase [Chitinophagaceae bacterium]
MLILTSQQVREWDLFTIKNKPISSINLMETAATVCCEWLSANRFDNLPIHIFCGKGNNGGDGLAIARIMAGHGLTPLLSILETGKPGTEDFQTNLARLHETSIQPHYIHSEENFPVVASGTVIIDAIYGTGLNRPAEGSAAKLIKHINAQKCAVIAIDLPSGLNPDHSSKNNTVVTATHTLSFQCFKPAFLFPENEDAIGQLHILDIGLEPAFAETLTDTDLFIVKDIASQLLRKRKSFSHKGDYGHAAIIAGSKGMMGAAVLSAKACLRSGA